MNDEVLQIGYEVERDMPCLKGAEVQALYLRRESWLRAHGR